MLQDRPTYSLFKSKSKASTSLADTGPQSSLVRGYSHQGLRAVDSKGCLLPIVYGAPNVPQKRFKKGVDIKKCQDKLFELKFDSREINKIPSTKWFSREKLFF